MGRETGIVERLFYERKQFEEVMQGVKYDQRNQRK